MLLQPQGHMSDNSDLDDLSYLRYTGPQVLHKALNTLHGIIQGIAIDGKVDGTEAKELTDWCDCHASFANRHPYKKSGLRPKSI